MIDENLNSGTAIPGEEAPATPAYSPPADDDAGGADDIESRARLQGWVPKEEFKGDQEKWRPADEFVKRGEEIVPILKERTRTLESKLDEAQRKLEAQERAAAERFQRLERMSETALLRQREQIVGSYEAAMRSAVEMGDVSRYDQLRNDMVTAVTHHDQVAMDAARLPQSQDRQAQVHPGELHRQRVQSEWEVKNPWMHSDQEMRAVAVHHSQELARKTPGITIEQNLAEVDKYIRARYADRFPGSKQGSGPVVEGGSRLSSSAQSRSRGAADLPADARRQGEKFVAQKLFKDLNEYARDYWSQEA